MNKNLIFSIALLGLMSGVVQGSHRPLREVAQECNVSVVVGWAIKSIAERKVCGSLPDAVCLAVPALLLEAPQEDLQKLGAMLTGVNIARIVYDLNKKFKPKRAEVAIQCDEEDLLPVGAQTITPAQAREFAELKRRLFGQTLEEAAAAAAKERAAAPDIQPV